MSTPADPAVLLTNDASAESEPQPGPVSAAHVKVAQRPKIPLWLPIVGVMLFVGWGLGLTLSKMDSFKTHAALSLTKAPKAAPVSPLKASTPAPTAQANRVSINQERTDQTATVPLVALPDKSVPIAQEPISVPLDHNNPQLTQLQNQLAQLALFIETQSEALETQQQDMIHQLNALNQKMLTLHPKPTVQPGRVASSDKVPVSEASETAVPPKPAPKLRRAAATKKFTSKITPPFTLVSVDHWGDALHVVVRYHGALQTLSEQQAVAGWRLVDTQDALGEGVTVRHQRGQTAVLTLN